MLFPKTIIIIPVYNEQGNIKPLIKNIFKYFQKNKTLLFIDDDSKDETQSEIIECQKKYKKIYLERRKSKLGIGSAHKFGFRWAYKRKYKIIITIDCDGTHHPKYINQMVNILIKRKFNIINTNRFLKKNSLKKWTMWRKILTTLRYLTINKMLNINYDSSGAFRCYNSDKVKLKDLLKAKNNSYSFFWESIFILNNKNYKIFEIPIDLPARLAGVSKMQFKDIFSALFYLLLFFFRKN
jgi:dolichol-phosphate mannosyltransferase